MQSRISIAILCLIIIGGAIIRFHRLGVPSYSNDELSAITRAEQPNLSQLIERGVRGDGHPAGVQVWLYYYTKWIGTDEFVVRLPFALLGIAAILMAYLVGAAWFNKTCGLLAAVAIAFLFLPVHHSQLARPYVPGVLWVLCMAWCLNKMAQANKPKLIVLIGWSVATVLALYNHYFSALAAVLIGIAGLFVIHRQQFRGYLVASGVAVLAFAPHIGVTIDQMLKGGLGRLDAPTTQFPADHVVAIFSDSGFLLIAALVVVAIHLTQPQVKVYWHRWHTIAALMFVLPLAIGMTWSLLVKPVLHHSVLVFTMPFGLMLLFSFFPSDLKHPWLPAVIGSLLSVAVLLGQKKYFSMLRTEPFKELVAESSDWLKTYDHDKTLPIASVNSPGYLNFYFRRHGYELDFPVTNCCNDQPLSLLDSVVTSDQRPFLLFINMRNPLPEEIEPVILRKYPMVIERRMIGTSSATLYARESSAFDDTTGTMRIHITNSGVESDNEDEFIGLATVQQIPETAKAFALRATIRTTHAPRNSEVAVSVERAGQSIFWKTVAISNYMKHPLKTAVVYAAGSLPSDRDSGDVLKTFIWNHDRQKVWVDTVDFVLF